MKLPLLTELVADPETVNKINNAALADFAEEQIGWYDTLLEMAKGLKENPQLMMGEARTPPRPVRHKGHLKKHIEKAADWKDWYQNNYDAIAVIFGEETEALKMFLKLLAATSQGSKPSVNVSLAINSMKKIVYDGAMLPDQFKGLKAAKKNISRIAHGGYPEGPKLGPYTKALVGDVDAIAVDRHIFNIFFGSESDSIGKRKKATEVIVELAQELNLENRQVQAALWAADQIRQGVTPENYINIIEKRKQELEEILSELRKK